MTHHQALPPFAATAGPRDARTVIVGEAWGQSEAQLRQPFVGESGKELWRLLAEAMPDKVNDNWHRAHDLHRYGLAWVSERASWLADTSVLLTNVLALQPRGNRIDDLCKSKKDLQAEERFGNYHAPAIAKGKYLDPQYFSELARLKEELAIARPNLIICMGNTACWALLHATNISSIRGAVALGHESGCAANSKCLPTYHPAAVLRQWNWRPLVVADLQKAAREAVFPEIRRPKRQVLVNPTIEEVCQFTELMLAQGPRLLGADCETKWGQIEMISFAPSRHQAISIPFIDSSKPGWSYWPSEAQELMAWQCVKWLLESDIPKCFQNGMYDLQYILRMGIRPGALDEDTMLLHHAMYPEMLKGLGFLGSTYTDEASWKLMRRKRPDTEKRDE